MPNPLLALVLYALWALVLVLAIMSWRGLLSLRGEYALNGFPGGSAHGPEAYWRLNRAHLNAVENLPVFGAVVVAGVMLGVSSPWFAQLAWVVLGARVAQSLIHVSGSSSLVVSLRFSALFVQIVSIVVMAALVFEAQG